MRKTDKYRLIEGRGKGNGEEYKPFYKTHEIPSRGRKHRLIGWFNRRIFHFLSDGEFYYFLILQWLLGDSIIDIREQYPLPLEETLRIAEKLGYKHPRSNNKIDKYKVITTDFLITFKQDNTIREIARAIKPRNELKNKRTIEKLRIEEAYFQSQNTDWGIVTEEEISKVMALNIKFLYHDYFWAEDMGFSEEGVNIYKQAFIKILLQNEYEIYKTCYDFERLQNWEEDSALCFFRYLLASKDILFDLNKKLNFSNMKIWLPEKEGIYEPGVLG